MLPHMHACARVCEFVHTAGFALCSTRASAAAPTAHRGAGEVLGDDAMRERCLAVSVVALSTVTTLRASPQKLLACLDLLTLRLFGKLAAQQGQAEQLIQVRCSCACVRACACACGQARLRSVTMLT